MDLRKKYKVFYRKGGEDYELVGEYIGAIKNNTQRSFNCRPAGGTISLKVGWVKFYTEVDNNVESYVGRKVNGSSNAQEDCSPQCNSGNHSN